MVIRITWGKLRAGSWDEFERTYRANVVTKGKGIKGLRGRWLSQDTDDRDTGFAVSLWESLADMQAYEQSALYREIMAPLQPFFVGEYKTYRSEVKYTDIPPNGAPEDPLLSAALEPRGPHAPGRGSRHLRDRRQRRTPWSPALASGGTSRPGHRLSQ